MLCSYRDTPKPGSVVLVSCHAQTGYSGHREINRAGSQSKQYRQVALHVELWNTYDNKNMHDFDRRTHGLATRPINDGN